MISLILRRLALGLLTIWLASLLIFATTELLPGDVASAILGQSATPEAVTALREKLGLDAPAPIRYLNWLTGVLSGDFGRSLVTDRPVTAMIGERLGRTLLLAGSAAMIAVPLALLLGILAAMRVGSGLDRAIGAGSLCLISLPEFFIATVLVIVFAVQLRWLPAVAPRSSSGDWLSLVRTLGLPVATLTTAVLAHMTRMTRTALLNVLSSSYVETAVLKGVAPARVIVWHALPNAIGPIANVVAINLAYLVGGAIVVETIFAYPGVAKLMVDGVTLRDLPLVQGCGILFCAIYIALNLAADLIGMVSNPRLRRPRS